MDLLIIFITTTAAVGINFFVPEIPESRKVKPEKDEIILKSFPFQYHKDEYLSVKGSKFRIKNMKIGAATALSTLSATSGPWQVIPSTPIFNHPILTHVIRVTEDARDQISVESTVEKKLDRVQYE